MLNYLQRRCQTMTRGSNLANEIEELATNVNIHNNELEPTAE